VVLSTHLSTQLRKARPHWPQQDQTKRSEKPRSTCPNPMAPNRTQRSRPAWGSRGPGFKSRQPDSKEQVRGHASRPAGVGVSPPCEIHVRRSQLAAKVNRRTTPQPGRAYVGVIVNEESSRSPAMTLASGPLGVHGTKAHLTARAARLEEEPIGQGGARVADTAPFGAARNDIAP
jgi:hypothetical protein